MYDNFTGFSECFYVYYCESIDATIIWYISLSHFNFIFLIVKHNTLLLFGIRGGIRTHVSFDTVLQTVAFSHSATLILNKLLPLCGGNLVHQQRFGRNHLKTHTTIIRTKPNCIPRTFHPLRGQRELTHCQRRLHQTVRS